MSVLIHFLIPPSIRAAGDLITIKDPSLLAAIQPVSIAAIQPIDLSGLRSIDIARIIPAATTPEALQPVSVVLNEEILSAQLPITRSFEFKTITPLNTRNFSIQSQLAAVNFSKITGNNQEYQKISLIGKEGFVSGEEGQPALPGFTKVVAIPVGAEMNVRVIEGEPKVITGIRVCPFQPIPEDQAGTAQSFETTPAFIDKINYRLNRFLPEDLIAIRYDMLRGCKVAIIKVTTARYNPALKELRLYPDLTLDISFTGGEDSYIPDEKRSLYFEDTYSMVLANSAKVGILSKAELLAKLGAVLYLRCDLLIITPDEFVTQAETLAAWKREKGFWTWVRTLDDIQDAQGGTSAAHIREYIRDIYDNHNLSYVLLMGDAEDIPTHYYTPSGSTVQAPTDLYYADMDNGAGQYFPDLAIGRLPVNSSTEAQRVVDRIIAYEKTPPTNSGFYRRVILGAYFQDGNNDGQDDRNYVQTIQELYSFFTGKGYTVQREYVSSSSNPQYYSDGTAIPADLKKPGFPWDGNAADIVTGLNEGAVLMAHRDHAGRSGWAHPSFTTSNFASLNTGSLSPVIFSINCQSGWFDNETDSDSSTTTESFAEQLVTRDGGAAAVIAATRNSPTYPNDDLVRGLTEFIWPDFHLTPSVTATSKRLGDVLNAAKLYVNDHWSGSTVQREFELYHCLGDPTMEVWTKNPHPTIIIPWTKLYKEIVYIKLPDPGPDPIKQLAGQFIVPASEDDVLVSLIRDGEILGQGISRNGQAVIDVDESVEDLTGVQVSYRLPSGYTMLVNGPESGGDECLCNEDDSGILDLGDAVGKAGSQVTIPVRIQSAPNAVESFGFDVVYDTDSLVYIDDGRLDDEKGPLSRSLDFFSVSDLGGRIHIGGFDSSLDNNSIVRGSTGVVVNLKFEIISEREDCTSPLRVEALVDMIRTWSASGGCVRTLPHCDGDLNGDGRITPGDALIAFTCSMGSGPCPACCDVNADGEVTVRDAECIFHKYMKLPSCLD
ncbi:MAG: C25 family cysteine peptidase [bacterium]